MITINDVLILHEMIIQKFGGTSGIRDISLLESAVNRPFSTFDGNDLYPTVIEKAGAIFESLIINHPFIDGNKRTAYVTMLILLKQKNFNLICSEDEKYKFVIAASKGEYDIESIKEWLRTNTEKT